MKVLRAKLYELARAEKEQEITSLKGERRKIDFGSQIRSYVLQPYRMIKDLRTGYESSDVDKVLDGDIDQFVESYLLQCAKIST